MVKAAFLNSRIDKTEINLNSTNILLINKHLIEVLAISMITSLTVMVVSVKIILLTMLNENPTWEEDMVRNLLRALEINLLPQLVRKIEIMKSLGQCLRKRNKMVLIKHHFFIMYTQMELALNQI